jgi:TRAP-type C4-dicarboxylate transport system permease small subunit
VGMGTLVSTLQNISNTFERITLFLIMISVSVLSIDLIIAVLSRYIFKTPIIWADELAIVLLAWITFLGASLSIKRNEMIAVTILVDRLKNRSQKILQILIQMIILTLSILFLIYGTRWVMSPDAMNTKLAAMQISVWIPYSIFPITMLMTCVFCLENIFKITKSES